MAKQFIGDGPPVVERPYIIGPAERRGKLNETDTQRPEDPSYQSIAYLKMQPFWTVVNDVYAGTPRMRECASTYLPQFPIESVESYKTRSGAVTLMNAYARTVDAMTGLVVGSGIKVNNLPAQIEPHLKNIDNAGTTFETFARETLLDSFQGHSVVLIDMPDVPNEKLPKNSTQQRKMKSLRPYWTRRRIDEIWNWRVEVIDGETIITQMTFRECVVVPVGEFGEEEEVRFLRWYMTTNAKGERVAAFKKYREVTKTKKGRAGTSTTETTYELISEKETHMSRLPVFVVYGHQEDGKILESKPPLLDLAYKNIEHMQIDSDYKKGLSIAGLAIPVLKTDKDSAEIEKTFGWDVVMIIEENEDFAFVEADGQALPNKVVALDNIKREMGVLGLSLIAERSASARITATERLLDSVQQSNGLMSIQASLLQGLQTGFEIHAEWMKLPLSTQDPNAEPVKGIEVELGLDWTDLVRSADHMQLLLEMAKEDLLSTATLLETAVTYGVLPSFVSPKEEISRLKGEGRVRQSRMAMKATPGGVQITGKPASDPLNPGNVTKDKATGEKLSTKTRLSTKDNKQGG